MNVNANLECHFTNSKCEFANLKYEQLLSEKYFIETCFSKRYSSYSPKQDLIDRLFKIGSEERSSCFPTTTTSTLPDCTTT